MISVIIPVYNAAAFVQEAVLSALMQPEVSEVILIEDGSTDSSLEICEKLKKQDERLILLRHPNGINKGAGASRNLGIQHAKNDWIAFLDADDYYLKDRFGQQIKIIAEYSGVAVVYASAIVVDSADDHTIKNPSKNIVFGLLHGGESLGTTPSNLWSKNHLLQSNGFDSNLSSSQEYDLMFKIYKAGGTFIFDTSAPKTIVRKHPGQRISNQSGAVLSQNWLLLRKKMIDYFGVNNLDFSDFEGKQLLYRLINVVYRLLPDNKANAIYLEFYAALFSKRNHNFNFRVRMRHLIYVILGFSYSEKIFDKIRWIIR